MFKPNTPYIYEEGGVIHDSKAECHVGILCDPNTHKIKFQISGFA